MARATPPNRTHRRQLVSTTITPAAGQLRPSPSPQPRSPVPSPTHKRKPWLGAAVGASFLLLLAPVVLFAGAGNPPGCVSAVTGGPGGVNDTGGAGGHFAAPLQLQDGQWYRVGATEYGPPGTGDFGSDPDPGQSDLEAHPDSFAELSTLDANPANITPSDFTFADADALGNLPYGTNLRVAGPSGRQLVLTKRDTGYGQGPGSQGPGALIYRIDVWNGVSDQLGISKSPVSIELAPTSGTAPTLGQTPQATEPQPAGACGDGGVNSGPLQLTAGQTAQINPTTGAASAPEDAPRPVKLAIAAANAINDTSYPPVEEHYYDQYLGRPWPAYDCSGSTSYVLWKAGLRGIYATDSTGLESYGDPGPGKWITIYANSNHVWTVIAGRAFDTADFGGPNLPAGSGPRWRSDPTGNLNDGTGYVVRHPAGAWND
jgi:hypothetical protein